LDEPARRRTERLSYYETARLSLTNGRVRSDTTVDVERPTYFLRYSALGPELGPFTGAEKARLVASANSTVTMLWRQDKGLAAPNVGRL